MTHDVYDPEMWAMIDEEDAQLSSHEEDVYEYLKEQNSTIIDTKKITLWTKVKQFIMRVNSKSTIRKAD